MRRSAGVDAMLAPPPVPGGVPDYFGAAGNYANSPMPTSVSIMGDGAGATAIATVTNGIVTGINVTNGGSGYTLPPPLPFLVEAAMVLELQLR